MKIILGKDIKNIDKKTIEQEGISSIDLMDRTANAITESIIKQYKKGEFYIFAGAGNNGGDALAIGINLHTKGYKVHLIHFIINNELSKDCKEVKSRISNYPDLEYIEVIKSFTKPPITAKDIIIDGLFGSGLNKPLAGGFANVANFINGTGATIYSIDLPSGLMCEDNSFNVIHNIVKADKTFCVQIPKLVFMFQEFSDYVGDIELVNIGLSEEAIQNTKTDYAILEREQICPIIKKRKRFTHKGNYGKALIIAGSYGMSGAATLAAKSCLKSGVGLLKVHVPSACVNILQTTVPEAIVYPDFHEHVFTALNNDDEFTTIAIGPGLGQDSLTAEGLKQTIISTTQPMVIDADAINILSENRNIFKNIPAGSILTPHIKEFDRLVGQSRDPYERIMKAAELASSFTLYIVLKSAITVIITPQKKFWFSTTGNPGMATAGSGDVLTGMITALLAQGYSSLEASILGTYAHGIAGDIAASKFGEIGMTAMDIANSIPEAWKELSKNQL